MERRDSAPNLPIFSRIHDKNHQQNDEPVEEGRVAALARRSSLPLEVLTSSLSLSSSRESLDQLGSSTTLPASDGMGIAGDGGSDHCVAKTEASDRDSKEGNKAQQPQCRPTSIPLPSSTNHPPQYPLHYDNPLYRHYSSNTASTLLPQATNVASPLLQPYIPPPPTPPMVPSSYERFYYHTPALPFQTLSPSMYPETRTYPVISQRPHHHLYHRGSLDPLYQRQQAPYFSASSPLREVTTSGSSSSYFGSKIATSPSAVQQGFITPPRTQRIPRINTAPNVYQQVTPSRGSNSFKTPSRDQKTLPRQQNQPPRHQTSGAYHHRHNKGQYHVQSIERRNISTDGNGSSDDEVDSPLGSSITLVSTKFVDTSFVVWVGNLPIAGDQVVREHFAGIEIKDIEIHFETFSCCLALGTADDMAKALHYDGSKLFGTELKVRPLKTMTTPTETSLCSKSGSSIAHTPPRLSKLATRLFATPPRSPAHELGDPLGRNEREGDFTYEDRYFIMKSLSIEDLDIARERGYWATQAKNETILNRAFHNTRNVYLIFSANKSGEFYGCARMESGIEGVNDPLFPSSLNSTVDGSCDSSDYPDESSNGDNPDDDDCHTNASNAPDIQWTPVQPPPFNHDSARIEDYVPPKWGSPFKIRWLVIHPLPFQQTKHLRNAWNANKQVKVSRDGTEVETTAGRRIIQEFQIASSKASMVRTNSNSNVPASLINVGTGTSQALEVGEAYKGQSESDQEEELTTVDVSYARLPSQYYQQLAISPAMIGSPLIGPGSPFLDTTYLHLYPSSPTLNPGHFPSYSSPTI